MQDSQQEQLQKVVISLADGIRRSMEDQALQLGSIEEEIKSQNHEGSVMQEEP